MAAAHADQVPGSKHRVRLLGPLCALRVRSLKMYNNLVERCFKECVEDMRSKTMSTKEEQARAAMWMMRSVGAAAAGGGSAAGLAGLPRQWCEPTPSRDLRGRSARNALAPLQELTPRNCPRPSPLRSTACSVWPSAARSSCT